MSCWWCNEDNPNVGLDVESLSLATPARDNVTNLVSYFKDPMSYDGTVQKRARLNRLKNEIIDYVSSQPQCSAADIVDYLSNERKMRNHGLTTRKVGFFIPRYLSEMIGFTLDNSTGKRLYHLAS
jgi:hypothetical protein